MDRVILGLDISTSCIGIAVYGVKNDIDGRILLLTHVAPKVKPKGIEGLFLKKRIFHQEFLKNCSGLGITDVVVESPLASSNNINTCMLLTQFNGMICDAVYETLGVVPVHISSYDARKYAFPELMAIRQFDKKGAQYPTKKILKAMQDSVDGKRDKKGKMVSTLSLFGEFPWDIDKKSVILDKVNEAFNDIAWIYNAKGELVKENYDMSDALAVALAYVNMQGAEEYEPKVEAFTKKGLPNGDLEVTYEVSNLKVDMPTIKHKFILLNN